FFVSVSAVKGGDKTTFQGLADEFIQKLEAATGLSVLNQPKAKLKEVTVEQFLEYQKRKLEKDQKVFIDKLGDGSCQMLFGKEAWDKLQASMGTGVGTKPGGGGDTGNSSGTKSSGKGGGGRKFKSKPPWAVKLKQELDKLRDKAKTLEPKAEDIPDTIYVYCYEDSEQWRVQGKITGPPTINGFQRVDAGSSAAETFQRIRLKLQSARVDRELKEAKEGQAQELDKEDLWAEAIRLKIWAQMRKDRAARSGQTELNFPDALSLQVIKGDGDKRQIYLVVHVRVEKKDEAGQNKTSGYEIRGARLSQPMVKDMPIEPAIKQIKDIAFALRNPDKVAESAEKADKEPLPDVVHEAFPATILPDNMRADFQTVTGGQHEFYMSLRYTTWYQPGADSFVEAWQTSYTRWKLFKLPDSYQLPQDSQGKEQPLKDEWPGRRAQLQKHFDQQKEKLADGAIEGLVQKYKSSASVRPDQDIQIPNEKGIYVLYARTQIKPTDKRYIKPSHAVMVLKARNGYELAQDETNQRLDNIGALEGKMKKADGLQQLFIGAELNKLKKEEKAAQTVSLFSSTQQSMESLQSKLDMLPTIQKIAEKKARTDNQSVYQIMFEMVGAGKYQAYKEFWQEIENFPPKSGKVFNPCELV
ncbi:MAG: hypothetical protein AAFV07_15115, partial [Bacteroidota bacterium]